jgi:hypothetical protein
MNSRGDQSDLAAAGPELVSAAAAPLAPPKSRRGGARPGSGRKRFPAGKRKEHPAFVSLTSSEFETIERMAAERGLTISFLIREKLGLPID